MTALVVHVMDLKKVASTLEMIEYVTVCMSPNHHARRKSNTGIGNDFVRLLSTLRNNSMSKLFIAIICLHVQSFYFIISAMRWE